tara:strand:- start:520 stop:735 length:216 start_codon:yes stop_codon:yes gene_type:complete
MMLFLAPIHVPLRDPNSYHRGHHLHLSFGHPSKMDAMHVWMRLRLAGPFLEAESRQTNYPLADELTPLLVP